MCYWRGGILSAHMKDVFAIINLRKVFLEIKKVA